MYPRLKMQISNIENPRLANFLKEIIGYSDFLNNDESNERIKLELYGLALGLSRKFENRNTKSSYSPQVIEQKIINTIYSYIIKIGIAHIGIHSLEDKIKEFNRRLNEIRRKFFEDFDKNRSVSPFVSLQILNYFTEIMQYAIFMIGKPSYKYTVVCLGSLATNMATPYSDIEYIVFIDAPADQMPNAKTHFENVCNFFDFIILSFGESPIKDSNNFLKKVFYSDYFLKNFDVGIRVDLHKQPQDVNYKFSLINSPNGMLEKLSTHMINRIGNHLTASLFTTRYLCGDLSLYDSYQKTLEECIPTKEYFRCIKIILEEDLNSVKNISKELKNFLTTSINQELDLKRFLAAIINTTRGFLFFIKACNEKINLKLNNFEILKELFEKKWISNSSHNDWRKIIEALSMVHLKLQIERKSAFSKLTFSDLSRMLPPDVKLEFLDVGLDIIIKTVSNTLNKRERFDPLFSLHWTQRWIRVRRKIYLFSPFIIIISIIIFLIFKSRSSRILQKWKNKILDNPDLKSRLSMYIPLRGTLSLNIQETFDLLNHVLSFLKDPDKKVLLILADGGSGKSLFSEYLFYTLWNNTTSFLSHLLWGENFEYIPVLTDLAQVDYSNALNAALELQGLSTDQVEILREKYHFLWIFDGFDRVYNSHKISTIRDILRFKNKFIITSRFEHIIDLDEQEQFFWIPELDLTKTARSIQKIYIQSFNDTEIETYINKYSSIVTFDNKKNKLENFKQLLYYSQKFRAFVQSPLLLNMALKIYLEGSLHVHWNHFSGNSNVLRLEFYKIYINEWLRINSNALTKYEFKNLHGPQRNSFTKRIEIKAINIAKDLASKMRLANTTIVQKGTALWNIIYNITDDNSPFIRRILPLKVDENAISFVHDTFLDFFVALTLIEEGKPGTFPPNGLFHRLQLSKDRSVISFLGDELVQNSEFESVLWKTIRKSKDNRNNSHAAANSATTLNRLGISFSYRNLAKVNLEGADLSFGVFEGTRFTKANLNNVLFSGSWLKNVDFEGALMQGVEFGEWPFFDIENNYFKEVFFSKKGSYIVLLLGDELRLYNSTNFQLAYSFNSEKKIEKADLNYNENQMIIIENKNPMPLEHDVRFVIKYWNLAKNETVWEKELVNKDTHIKFYSDNQILVLSDSLLFLSSSNGLTLKNITIEDHIPSENYKIFFSSNVHVFGADYEDGALRIWSTETGKLLRKFSIERVFPFGLGFSVDGKIVGHGHGSAVNFWNVETGDFLCQPNFTGLLAVSSVTFNTKNQVAVSGFDGSVCIYDIEKNVILHKIHTGAPTWPGTTLSPKGDALMVFGEDKKIRFWNLKKTDYPFSITEQPCLISRIIVDPKKKIIAVGDFCGSIYLWDTENGRLKNKLGSGNKIVSLHFHKEEKEILISRDNANKTFAWCTNNGSLYNEWSINNKLEIFRDIHEDDNIFYLADESSCVSHKTVNFIVNGKKILNADCAFMSQIWNFNTNQMRKEFEINSEIWKEFAKFIGNSKSKHLMFDFSPDGKIMGWVMSRGYRENEIHFWDVSTGKRLGIIENIKYFAIDLIFFENTDKLFLVTNGIGNSIRCFELRINDNNTSMEIRLKWTTYQHELYVKESNIKSAHLTQINYDLLKQGGAIGNPIVEPEIKEQVPHFTRDNEESYFMPLRSKSNYIERSFPPASSAASQLTPFSWVSVFKRNIIDTISHLIWKKKEEIGFDIYDYNDPKKLEHLQGPIVHFYDSYHLFNQKNPNRFLGTPNKNDEVSNKTTILHSKPLNSIAENIMVAVFFIHLMKTICNWLKKKFCHPVVKETTLYKRNNNLLQRTTPKNKMRTKIERLTHQLKNSTIRKEHDRLSINSSQIKKTTLPLRFSREYNKNLNVFSKKEPPRINLLAPNTKI